MENGADVQSIGCLSVPSDTKCELLLVQSAFVHILIKTLWKSSKREKGRGGTCIKKVLKDG